MNREKINARRRARRKLLGYTETDRQEKRRYYVRHGAELKKKVLKRYYAIKADPVKYAKLRKQRRENLRAWRKRNPSKNVAYVRSYQKKNPDKVKKWDHIKYNRIKSDPSKFKELTERARVNLREWRARNPEKYRAQRGRNKQRHPEKSRTHNHRRRVRRKGWIILGSHTVDQWLARVLFYGWHCVYCGKKLDQKTLTKDHRIPLSKGGTDFPANLVPACLSCNSRKGNRLHK